MNYRGAAYSTGSDDEDRYWNIRNGFLNEDGTRGPAWDDPDWRQKREGDAMGTQTGDKPRGFYPKFRVQRVDGTPLPEGARYFVLRLDDDPHARAALRAYAEHCASENPALAADILAELARHEGGERDE